MRTLKLSQALLILSVVLLSVSARAEDSCKSPDGLSPELERKIAEFESTFGQAELPTVEIKVCNDPAYNLRKVTVGFKCRTSKGAIFERVSKDYFNEAWKGPDGLIWSDVVDSLPYKMALSLCKALDGALPSRANFGCGEANGFREVLPSMTIDRKYWTSSGVPRRSDNAYEFGAAKGDLGMGLRLNDYSVRCVGR